MTSAGVAVVKFGGGLITDKTTYRTPDREAISACAEAVAGIIAAGLGVVVVHGAGSYGHVLARRWRLVEGDSGASSDDGERRRAVETVRGDMIALADLVTAALELGSMQVLRHPPHQWVDGVGPTFSGDLSRFEEAGIIHLTHGDVVDIGGQRSYGILSGDDLMFRLATELPDVRSAVFAMGDVPGLLDGPPDDPGSSLLPLWHPGMAYVGVHSEDIDVTGGIHLKAERAASISEVVDDVWFVGGRDPTSVIAAACGGEPAGTRIVPLPARTID